MLILFSAIAFIFAYMSYQDGEMINFYIALGLGIFFIGLMVNNIIKVNKETTAKKKSASK